MLYKKMRAFYRSSTESDDTTAVALRLWPSDHNRIDVRYFGKSGGYSVRCFKDDENDILIDSKGGGASLEYQIL